MIDPDVVVITGAGGMGRACARRMGSGRRLLIADNSAASVDAFVEALRIDGFSADGMVVDVRDPTAVAALATAAAALGRVCAIVHTAGVSPTMADADTIIAVDLVGTANVIDAFEAVVGPGSAGVCIASMAGTITSLSADVERFLATAPSAELSTTGTALGITDPSQAYGYAKRANQLRVEAAASRWGRLGARIVSVSPGIISTGMGHQELSSEIFGGVIQQMIDASPAGRIGTAEDIAAVVDWLSGPAASLITGTDVLIDGGTAATMRWSEPSLRR